MCAWRKTDNKEMKIRTAVKENQQTFEKSLENTLAK